MTKILGLICAKTNSKRFPGKNELLIKDNYDALYKSKINKICINLDEGLFHIHKKKNFWNSGSKQSILLYRNKNISEDNQSLIEVAKHSYYLLDEPFNYIVLLFANTINISTIDIDNAINLCISKRLKEVRLYNKEANTEAGCIVFETNRLLNEPISSYIGALYTEGQEIHYEEELNKIKKTQINRKCKKCGKEHPDNWVCGYNQQYCYWLNRELEKVERVVLINDD